MPHAIRDSFHPYDLLRGHWKGIRDGTVDIHAMPEASGFCTTEKQGTHVSQTSSLTQSMIVVQGFVSLVLNSTRFALLVRRWFRA